MFANDTVQKRPNPDDKCLGKDAVDYTVDSNGSVVLKLVAYAFLFVYQADNRFSHRFWQFSLGCDLSEDVREQFRQVAWHRSVIFLIFTLSPDDLKVCRCPAICSWHRMWLKFSNGFLHPGRCEEGLKREQRTLLIGNSFPITAQGVEESRTARPAVRGVLEL